MTDDTEHSDESRTAEECLAACRQAGFAEGQWFYDVRGGYCTLDTLQATLVIAYTDLGQPIVIGTAIDLYDWYQSGSIYPITPTALANARAVMLAAAQRQVDLALDTHERDDPWPHSKHVTTIADLAAVVYFFERATEQGCSIETVLS
jgi:hypothetical protein